MPGEAGMSGTMAGGGEPASDATARAIHNASLRESQLEIAAAEAAAEAKKNAPDSVEESLPAGPDYAPQLMFPLDINRPDGHPFIDFELQKYTGVKFDTNQDVRRKYSTNWFDEGIYASEDALGAAKAAVGTAVRGTSGAILGTPQGDALEAMTKEAAADPNSDSAKALAELDMIKAMSKERIDIVGNIKLYLPIQLQENYSVKWAEAEVGQGGSLIQTGLDSIRDLVDSGDDVMREIIGRLAGRGFNTPGLKDLMTRNAGAAVNNHLEAFFKGVGFRKFSYSFQLFPKSPREAEQVALIVRFFKAAAAPELMQPGETYGRYWAYPNQFQIRYWNNETTHNIGLCFLSDITVNYGAAGTNQSFVDAFPLQTDLNLTFTEMELVHKDQIMNKGY